MNDSKIRKEVKSYFTARITILSIFIINAISLLLGVFINFGLPLGDFLLWILIHGGIYRTFGNIVFGVGVFWSIATMIAYILSWVLYKRSRAFIFVSTIVFAINTTATLALVIYLGIISLGIDIFNILVFFVPINAKILIFLISGVVAGVRLKNLPFDEIKKIWTEYKKNPGVDTDDRGDTVVREILATVEKDITGLYEIAAAVELSYDNTVLVLQEMIKRAESDSKWSQNYELFKGAYIDMTEKRIVFATQQTAFATPLNVSAARATNFTAPQNVSTGTTRCQMLTYNELEKTAQECGFTHSAKLDISTLEFMQEVRDMCNAEQCNNYDKSWSCPPACASLEEMRDVVKNYATGILVQTVGTIEDSLDWDGMMEVGARHKENFGIMKDKLRAEGVQFLAMGAGKCQMCESCTYPDEPCRVPDKMEVSMEASGLFVSKVCKDNGLEYNYGANNIAFTSCFLCK